MSTITSFDDALDFMPSAKGGRGRPNFFATLRIIAEGVREGLEAERRYHELTGRRVSHADAVRMMFAELHQAR